MSKSEYQIVRVAKYMPNVPDIAKGLANMAKASFPGYPFENVYDPTSLASAITAGECRLIAMLKPDLQQVIGTAVLGLSTNINDPDRHMAEIKRVMTDTDHRGNGVAKAMTEQLVAIAKEHNVHPYTDTRADQIGMQRASLNAGLIPYSAESGKHVVYIHGTKGPARETMIHMSQLKPQKQRLYEELKKWDPVLKAKLIKNMSDALNPRPKSSEVSKKHLPSAEKVKKYIKKGLENCRSQFEVVKDMDDVTIIKCGSAQMAIINPDASGFIQFDDNANISAYDTFMLMNIAQEIGLQIVTTYQDVSNVRAIHTLVGLQGLELEPAMIRPWQVDSKKAPQWQVGLRKTMNGYEDCLHEVDIDGTVKQPMIEFIDNIVKNTN